MTNDVAILAVCTKLQELGYTRASHIRMYGEEFEIVSDPFPDDQGVAVRAIATSQLVIRTLRLPLPVLQMARNSLIRQENSGQYKAA